MKYQRSGADPCMYFRWFDLGLVVWLSWIDDCMVWGPEELVKVAKNEFIQMFECDDVGDVDEYVGCKIVRNYDENSFKFTQPVMIQSFKDEYDTKETRTSATPAEPGSVLVKAMPEDKVGKEQHTYYRSGVGKLLHMMRWSRPDVQNAKRDCSR